MKIKMDKKDILTFKKILKVFEQRSTCIRLKVAAIIVKDGRIISTGWNGVPSGMIHCKEYFKDKSIENHHDFSEKYEIHSEANAISFAAKTGISTNNSILFVSLSPCVNCAKLIIQSGIKEIYYITKYDNEDSNIAIENLLKNNIKVIKI